jgi:dolichol-phosphate mannosyltransferase
VAHDLITGAAGFVGANLVRRLLADGREVIAQVRPGTDRWRLAEAADRVRFVEADLRRRDEAAGLFAGGGVERVFHLAAHGGSSWHTDPVAIAESNFNGTVHLLEAALDAGVRAFVHAGSSSEYGFRDHPPAEDEAPEPNSHYAVAKTAATLWCRHAARTRGKGTRIATLRLYSAYGPWEAPGRLLPTVMLKGLAGELPPLVHPDVARDFVHVDDVTEAFVRAAERDGPEPGAVWNVATGRQTTIRDVVAFARAEFGIRQEPAWGTMPDRTWDTTCWVGNPARAARDLGWTPRVAFADGFRGFARWFRDRPDVLAAYRARVR